MPDVSAFEAGAPGVNVYAADPETGEYVVATTVYTAVYTTMPVPKKAPLVKVPFGAEETVSVATEVNPLLDILLAGVP